MIRLIPRRRIRIPHLAAVLAALLLVASSWIGESVNGANGPEQAQAGVVSVAQGGGDDASDTTSRKRKLSISLLLLGRG